MKIANALSVSNAVFFSMAVAPFVLSIIAQTLLLCFSKNRALHFTPFFITFSMLILHMLFCLAQAIENAPSHGFTFNPNLLSINMLVVCSIFLGSAIVWIVALIVKAAKKEK